MTQLLDLAIAALLDRRPGARACGVQIGSF